MTNIQCTHELWRKTVKSRSTVVQSHSKSLNMFANSAPRTL